MTAAAGTRTPNHKEHTVPEEVTPETGNTTETTAPTVDWESAENPYVQRYREAQSHLTPVQQENARLRRYEEDKNAYFELGQKHGVEFEFPEEQQAPTGDPQTAQELAELRAWKEEVETERQNRAYAEGERAVRTQHDEWAKEAGIKLSDFDHDAIIKRALDSGANDIDDVKGIFDAYVEHRKTERDQIRAELEEERKRPRVPHTPGGSGATETGVPDWSGMTPAQIDKYMAERAMGG